MPNEEPYGCKNRAKFEELIPFRLMLLKIPKSILKKSMFDSHQKVSSL